MLQATNIVQPDGTSVTFEYYLTRELKRQYGSRTYPVAYSYDYAGRMQTMTNWSSFPNAGTRVTTWNYNPYRGWLDSKQYPDGHGPSYSYTAAGRLQTRTWVRTAGGQPLVTTYGFNNVGELDSVNYSDSTPDVTHGFNRLGRLATNQFNGITTTLAYNTAGELLSESFSGGTLDGLTVTSAYDQHLRRSSLSLAYQQSALQTINYGYDAASRLQTVTDNSGATPYSAANTYLANSPLVGQIVFATNGITRMTTTKQYDFLNRLTQVSTVDSGQGTLDSHAYAYNSANQRVRSVLADGSYWLYEYDSLGQVRSGRKYWPDQSPVAGQQFEYAFDDIGNRTSTKAGGDENGWNLRSASYGANSLNQYTNRTVPGAVDVMGIALATNAVTVNGQATYRKGEYFRKELSVTGPAWEAINVTANNETPVTGHQFVPQSPEAFGHDADGNLVQDARWNYCWDAESRLVGLTNRAAVAPAMVIRFEYDPQGRRIRKQVWSNSDGSGTPATDLRFVYDGWNLIATLNSQLSTLSTFVWGSDLSGTIQGAGGIGGLLFICDVPSGIGYCAPAYDGNGNVAAVVSMCGGTNCATYEYGSFGEIIRATGAMAKINPFRFSTKYQDDETDLLYYNYRYYNPSKGRWISRDPIGEEGGANLYGFIRNDPNDNFDPLGFTTGSISVLFSKPINKFGHAGWSIRLRWTPPADWSHADKICCGRCKKVIWVQNYSWIMRKTQFGIYLSQDWTKDWDETDYSGNSTVWECGAWPRGHRLDNAEMWDDPEIYGVTWYIAKTMDFRAESRVKCIDGLEKGQIYGGVLWGYYYDATGGWGGLLPKVTGGVKGIW